MPGRQGAANELPEEQGGNMADTVNNDGPGVVGSDPVQDPVSFPIICTLGALFFLAALFVFYTLVATWPVSAGKGGYAPVHWLGHGLTTFSPDGRLFITVAAAGALGSLIHTLTSFVDYVGNRRLAMSWIWWLLLRVPIGVALALIFYLVLRGGLFSPSLPGGTPDTNILNPYGFAAVAAMAGMFSKQATDKLREIFDTLFHTTQPVDRADPLDHAAPTISAVEPPKLAVNDPAKTLTITGSGFKPGSKATVNGKPRDIERTSDTQIKLPLEPDDVKAAGTLQIVVQTPEPKPTSSKPFSVKVE